MTSSDTSSRQRRNYFRISFGNYIKARICPNKLKKVVFVKLSSDLIGKKTISRKKHKLKKSELKNF